MLKLAQATIFSTLRKNKLPALQVSRMSYILSRQTLLPRFLTEQLIDNTQGLVHPMPSVMTPDQSNYILKISTFKRKKTKVRKDRARTIRRRLKKKSEKKRKKYNL